MLDDWAATNFAEQYVVHDGKLANVYVYVKGGPPAAMMRRPTPISCRW